MVDHLGRDKPLVDEGGDRLGCHGGGDMKQVRKLFRVRTQGTDELDGGGRGFWKGEETSAIRADAA